MQRWTPHSIPFLHLFQLMYIQSKCNELFAKDYNIAIISNRQGELCATYPYPFDVLVSI